MKYYFNFICQPNDGALGTETTADGYRFPTDPMYKQDGVYNQRCKYKLNKNIEKKHKEKKEKNNNDFINTDNLNQRF